MTEVTTVPLAELRDFAAERLVPDEKLRVDVVAERCTVPLLVVPRTGASKLLVLNNGAVDQERAGRSVVFQRSTWSDEIRHHQVYVYDPATGAPDFLRLGWGQLAPKQTVFVDIVRIVRRISLALGVESPADRTYFGSSAGGFIALSLAVNDPGARSVINNAQFDWTRWMAKSVNALRAARFGNQTPQALREKYPLTTNVLNLMAKRSRPLHLHYLVNLASKHDRQIDYPMFQQFMMDNPEICADVTVSHYFDPDAGHNPLHRSRLVPILNGAVRDGMVPVSDSSEAKG